MACVQQRLEKLCYKVIAKHLLSDHISTLDIINSNLPNIFQIDLWQIFFLIYLSKFLETSQPTLFYNLIAAYPTPLGLREGGHKSPLTGNNPEKNRVHIFCFENGEVNKPSL